MLRLVRFEGGFYLLEVTIDVDGVHYKQRWYFQEVESCGESDGQVILELKTN